MLYIGGMESENTPLLIAWKALSTVALVAVMTWYGSTFVASHHVDIVAHAVGH